MLCDSGDVIDFRVSNMIVGFRYCCVLREYVSGSGINTKEIQYMSDRD